MTTITVPSTDPSDSSPPTEVKPIFDPVPWPQPHEPLHNPEWDE